jgi:protein involved in polysaccharide export with SLBB domain
MQSNAWLGTAFFAAWLGLSSTINSDAAPPGHQPPPADPPLGATTTDRKFPPIDSIKPLPLDPIPDDPPPHEGAMIGLTHVIEPPDLIMVEVLEALPGRPITGERLVRPDGKITLGFYGEVEVAGLTPAQAKEKIVLLLREFLTDDSLGLWRFIEGPVGGKIPNPPDVMPPKSTEKPPTTFRPGRRPAPVLKTSRRLETAASSEDPQSDTDNQSNSNATVNVVEKPQASASSGIKILIEIPNGSPPPTPTPTPMAAEPPVDAEVEEMDMAPPASPVAPADSDRVFVDVTAYNSKAYWIQGDVAAPGRLPWSGNETVLDALNYASGLTSSADPKEIQLIRPARGGKPARIYQIDLEAILKNGDKKANLQLFPGDRLFVGRDKLVKRKAELDRLASPLQSVLTQMTQYLVLRRLVATSAKEGLTPAQTEAMINEWVDMWWKLAMNPEPTKLDENVYKEMMRKALKLPPAASDSEKR